MVTNLLSLNKESTIEQKDRLPPAPQVAVGAVLIKEKKILLAKRKKEPTLKAIRK